MYSYSVFIFLTGLPCYPGDKYMNINYFSVHYIADYWKLIYSHAEVNIRESQSSAYITFVYCLAYLRTFMQYPWCLFNVRILAIIYKNASNVCTITHLETFTPALFVKVSDIKVLCSIALKVSESHPLVFCQL